MIIRLLPTVVLLAVTTAQKAPTDAKSESKPSEDQKPPVVLLATHLNEPQPKSNGTVPEAIKQLYAAEQPPPELYQLTYLQPQYQAHQAVLPRYQPQIVLYGAGGQGQPILINPGNPPGNFLIPQGPGPNVILRNNPQGAQGPAFPVAGYPKPAHIPPIEKDAEEIPTNPANIPPLPANDAKPVGKPKAKPEKLETFTESNQPDQIINGGQIPQFHPENVSLRPGQRFFVLNGDNIFTYPFEAQPEVPEFPAFRYTQVQQEPFPQNPPKLLQPFAQEPPQFLQVTDGQFPQGPISVPNLLLRNSFVNSQQLEPHQEPPKDQQPEKIENDGALKTAQQYFRTGQLPNDATFVQNPQAYLQDYLLNPQGIIVRQPQNQPIQGRTAEAKDIVVQPQVIGQFRFVPETSPGFYQFRDDVDNDAIVVDASFNGPENFNERISGDVKEEETVSSTQSPQPNQNEPEASMAQAGPQATAIAGPGGVAGSAPRGTAIVGKGGLAVSSPQATAVAGTKDEEKKKRPVKKDV